VVTLGLDLMGRACQTLMSPAQSSHGGDIASVLSGAAGAFHRLMQFLATSNPP
jgi:hypothetical protein